MENMYEEVKMQTQTTNLEYTLRVLERQVRWIERRMERLEGVGVDDATTHVIRAVLTRDLSQANHAVSRAKAGKYGICEWCRGSIETSRLKTRQVATTCASCEKSLSRRMFVVTRGLQGDMLS